MKKGIILTGLIIILAGVYFFIRFMPVNISENDPKNISYEIEGKEVRIINGISTTEITPDSVSKTITRYFGNEVIGDFNTDGREDTAFLLTQEAGGSGTFFYVAAALKLPEGYQGTNAILLGDRIIPQTTEYRGGEIIVNFADRKAGEPMTTQPSVGVSRYFKISSGKLIEILK